ncbi:MAG: VWA domain-containing protein [Acidobacteriaceae bacterium]
MLRTSANLVLVDVVVTKDGKPVQGLTAQQFHIFEDGKAQRIVTFDEHRADDATQVRPAPPLPPDTWANYPQFAITSAANVLLLDALNTPVADQAYARRQMIEYLKRIPPGTRIAVFTLASRLRMITGFTTDAGAIEAAIRHGKGGVQQSSVLESPQDEDMMGDVAASMAGVDGGAMQQFLADMGSFHTDLRVRMTLDAMEQLARYLSMIPGRKNLIWFSGSFPLQIQPDATLDPSGGSSPKDLFLPMREYADQLKATDMLLQEARVAVYPVDARGLLPPSSASASRSFAASQGLPSYGGGRGERGGGWAPPQQSGASAANQADTKFVQVMVNEHQAMQQIAEETGGEPFYDTNGLKEAVAQAIDNGSNYYTIGYVPDATHWDGSFRRIETRVEGGSYDLEYRRGYYAVDPLKPSAETPGMASPIVAALERGAPPLSQIVFEARVLAASDPAAKMVKVAAGPAGELASHLRAPVVRYLVDFSIDPHGIEWTAMAGGEAHAEIEVSMVAWNGDGERVNYTDKGIAFNLNPAQAAVVAKGGLPIHQEIDLPAGRIYLRVAVHDLRSGKIGSMEVPLEVAKK